MEGEAPCGIAEMMPREQDARERFDWFPYAIMFKKMKAWAASFMGAIESILKYSNMKDRKTEL